MERMIAPEIKNRPGLEGRVAARPDLLVAEMGSSASSAKAEWTLSQDTRSRDVIELRVSDWTGTVGYRFAPDELESRDHMQYRLHRLWGDLLMVRSHVQMDGRLGPHREP